jgi:predicted acetyltransferase
MQCCRDEPLPPRPQNARAMSAPCAVEVVVRRALADDRLPLLRMLELYQHDLSDIWDQDLDVHGEYGYPLDRHGSDPSCHAFVATVNGRYAGLALVDASIKVGTTGHWMEQFFVLKKYRRAGVGRTLAQRVFAALPGAWEVGQMPRNAAARAFWRNVIGEYAGGAYVEHELRGGRWEGTVQCFVARPPA